MLTDQTEQAVKTLLAKAEAQPPKHGDIYISEPIVMVSGAGYYIGMVCIEYLLDEWVPQPYDRLSEYYKSNYAAQAILDLGVYDNV